MKAPRHTPLSASDRQPRRRPPALFLALFLLLLTALCAAAATCDARSTEDPVSSPSATASPRADTLQRGDDWGHQDAVLGYLRQKPPKRPLVILLGGSATRECTVSDRNWRSQIRAMGGPSTLAFNLAATGESYLQDINFVRLLPDVPTLILIGVNANRYTQPPEETPAPPKPVTRPLTLTDVDTYAQHRFHYPHMLSFAKKSALLTTWLQKRYPVFQDRFSHNAGQLKKLVALCQERGFKVVLLNLPLNLQVVKHRMDAPRNRYGRNCTAVSAQYGVPWVDFISGVGLVNRDFTDNWHLLEPGRVKWQRRLSKTVITWLARYGVGRPTSPEPTPTPAASAAAADPSP